MYVGYRLSANEIGVPLQPCRLTMALIQIGAKGEVQPFALGAAIEIAHQRKGPRLQPNFMIGAPWLGKVQ